MKLRSVTSAALAAGLLLALVGAAVPASAATLSVPTVTIGPDLPLIWDLMHQRILLTSSQLIANGGPVEQGAWSSRQAAMGAQDAQQYSVRSVYGLEDGLASVQPIGPGEAWESKLFGKFKMPKFGGLGLRAGLGPLTVALAGWEFRTSITDGVMGLTGLGDKTNEVCSNSTLQSAGVVSGAVNFVTGVDCAKYKYDSSYVVNLGIVGVPEGWDSAKFTYNSGGVIQQWVWQGVTDTGTSATVAQSNSPWDLGSYFSYQCWDGTNLSGFYPVGGTGPLTPAPASYDVRLNMDCGAGQHVGTVKFYANSAIHSIWGLKGTANYSPGQPADPDHTFVCNITGDNGQHYTATTQTFKEVAGGTPPQIACPQLPAGVTATHWLETETGYNPDKVLIDQDSLPDTSAGILGAPTEVYCQTHKCILDLIDKTSGATCFSEGATCDGWLTDPNSTTKYQCQYGGHDVDRRECFAYAQIFNVQKNLAGDPYADPMTGKDTGVQNGVSVDEATMARGAEGAANVGMPDVRNCFGAGWGAANPLEWVLRPLQCGAEWAFVPRNSAVQAAQITNTAAFSPTIMAKLPSVVGAWHFIPPTNGCSGIPVDVFFLGPAFHIMGACQGDMLSGMALWARLFGDVSFSVLGALALTRYAGKTFGYTGLGSGANS